MRKRVFLYVRVSTQEQAKEGYSIDEQIARLEKYCDAKNWIVAKIYTDAGHSGGNTKRPALQKLMKDCKAKKGDLVVVYKLDRLSRSQKDTLELIEDYFLANGVDFVSMTENFDTSTAFGKAMIGILSVFAQLEREQIKERMAMGREGRAKKGKFHGSSVIPIGYDYIDGKLVINEFDAMQVRKIFEMYIAGKSPYKIADYMNEHGYKHKYGVWYADSVSNCITKHVYIGKIAHMGTVYDGEHEAIVDEETFEKANALKQQKSEEHAKNCQRRGKITSYLGSYLECGCCGAKYSKRTRICKTHRYEKYICYSRWKSMPKLIKDPNCKNKIWDMNELDNIIFDEIKKLSLDSDYLKEIISKDDGEAEVIQKEINKLDEQIVRLMDLYTLGMFPIDALQKKTKELNEQKEKLEHELEKIMDEEKAKLSHQKTVEIVNSFSDILENGDFDEIRTVIGALIDKIVINGDNITIHWKFT